MEFENLFLDAADDLILIFFLQWVKQDFYENLSTISDTVQVAGGSIKEEEEDTVQIQKGQILVINNI